MALTDAAIRKAGAKQTAYRLTDGGGLYLQVTPAGGKLWRRKYRFDGREKLMAFGKYPEVSLAQARERHAEARKLLASGIDPMAERKAEKAFNSLKTNNRPVSQCAAFYLALLHLRPAAPKSSPIRDAVPC